MISAVLVITANTVMMPVVAMTMTVLSLSRGHNNASHHHQCEQRRNNLLHERSP
jgi:hypothetical protein